MSKIVNRFAHPRSVSEVGWQMMALEIAALLGLYLAGPPADESMLGTALICAAVILLMGVRAFFYERERGFGKKDGRN